jgi:GNAT superfamily N-acetyltransferase
MHSQLLDGKRHNRTAFDCGEPALNHYLRAMAGQQARKDNARTYVLESDEKPGQITGYYTVSMARLDLEKLPLKLRKKHLHAYSTGLIARLAVDQSARGRGYGSWLLIDALVRLQQASDTVGFPLIVVDAKSGARAFYERFGFQSFLDEPDHLYITVAEVRAGLKP